MTPLPKPWHEAPWEALRVRAGFCLADLDRSATPGWEAGKLEAAERLAEVGEEMSELQERLHAQGRSGGRESVLLVLQGLDTAGKGGIARHVIGLVDPQGVALRAFGRPTAEELANHYLWRIRRARPPAGKIGVFDRSHYEDVLVVRVEGLVPEATWRPRYEEINAFEAEVAAAGTRIVKCALMVSHEEQGARLLQRLDRPDKHWKYSPSDLPTRLRWDDYQAAYQDVFELTSTEVAPWHVIPADHKWYSRLAIAEILTQTLREMDLRWPAADFDVAAERAKLLATMQRPEEHSIEAQDEEDDARDR